MLHFPEGPLCIIFFLLVGGGGVGHPNMTKYDRGEGLAKYDVSRKSWKRLESGAPEARKNLSQKYAVRRLLLIAKHKFKKLY